mmetsp:Transcript_92971/g.189403  ORF Transcript_92971/g.189403 Transcript_92971/m.189403 type:complete len:96 (-) Transcript_92971:358-645(-)
MSHLTNPQAQRTLKLLTAVACTGVGIQSVFFSTYETVEGFEGKEHVFTHVQRDARDFIDRVVYGIDRNQELGAVRRGSSSTNNKDGRIDDRPSVA